MVYLISPVRACPRHAPFCRTLGQLLNSADDLFGDAGSDVWTVRESDIIVSLIELTNGLVGPFNHLSEDRLCENRRERSARLNFFITSEWLVTRPWRICSSPLRTRAS